MYQPGCVLTIAQKLPRKHHNIHLLFPNIAYVVSSEKQNVTTSQLQSQGLPQYYQQWWEQRVQKPVKWQDADTARYEQQREAGMGEGRVLIQYHEQPDGIQYLGQYLPQKCLNHRNAICSHLRT